MSSLNSSAAQVYQLRCKVCDEYEGARKEMKIISCEGTCCNHFHIKCVNLPAFSIDLLVSHAKNLTFKCDTCVNTPTTLSHVMKVLVMQQKTIASMSEEMKTMCQKMTRIDTKMDDVISAVMTDDVSEMDEEDDDDDIEIDEEEVRDLAEQRTSDLRVLAPSTSAETVSQVNFQSPRQSQPQPQPQSQPQSHISTMSQPSSDMAQNVVQSVVVPERSNKKLNRRQRHSQRRNTQRSRRGNQSNGHRGGSSSYRQNRNNNNNDNGDNNNVIRNNRRGFSNRNNNTNRSHNIQRGSDQVYPSYFNPNPYTPYSPSVLNQQPVMFHPQMLPNFQHHRQISPQFVPMGLMPNFLNY